MISATSALCGLETMPMVFLAEVPMVKGRLYRIGEKSVHHGDTEKSFSPQRHRGTEKSNACFEFSLWLCVSVVKALARIFRTAEIRGCLRLRGLGIRSRRSRWRREIAPWLELFRPLAAESRGRGLSLLHLRARRRLRTGVLPAQLIRVRISRLLLAEMQLQQRRGAPAWPR